MNGAVNESLYIGVLPKLTQKLKKPAHTLQK